MRRQAFLFLPGVALLALTGADIRGCSPIPDPVPPVAASGGGTTGQGTGGSSGTTGDGWACSSLDEAKCLVRTDCRPVYAGPAGGCMTPPFERCEERVCPAVACSAGPGESCRMITAPDGCPVCDCSPQTCSTDADCPGGQVCDLTAGTSGGSGGCGAGCGAPAPKEQGVCKPGVVCPMVACAPADPTWVCTTSPGPDGCPTCDCHPSSCTEDSQCGAGEHCRITPCPADMPRCEDIPPGTQPPCCVTVGSCVPDDACATDSDCPAGQQCLPDPTDICNWPTADCFQPGRLSCQPPPPPCAGDADCAAGQVCRPAPATGCPPGAACDPATFQVCVPAPGCGSDADCASGEVCAADPTDPCAQPDAVCPYDRALRTVCQPAPASCGNVSCAPGEVCVHDVGGVPDPNGDPSVDSYSCAPFPQACAAVDSCDCVGHAICGSASTTTCVPHVSVECYVP